MIACDTPAVHMLWIDSSAYNGSAGETSMHEALVKLRCRYRFAITIEKWIIIA